MQPRVAIAIAADYNGRWSQQVVNDAQRAATGVKAASSSMGNDMRAANANVANLASQFNDIGVMLAAGQNPLQLALQQGTQISQVLGPLGAAGAAKALGAALMSMLSPVSLITIATIGLGAAAVQWLMSINREAPKAEDRLKAHREWLGVILTGYEDAEKAAVSYIEEASKLPQAVVESDLAAKQREQLKAVEEQYRSILKLLDEYEQNTSLLFGEFYDAPEMELAGAELTGVRDALRELTADGKLSADELDRLTTILTELKNQTADADIRQMAEAGLAVAQNFRAVNAELNATNAAMAQFKALSKDYTGALSTLGDIGRPPVTDRDKAAAARDRGLGEAEDAITRTAVLKAYNEAIARIETREAEEEALKRTKDAEAAAKSLANSHAAVTRSLQDQLAVLGMTAVEQEKYEQVRAAGVDANSAEAEAIRASVQALHDRRDALEVINAMKSPADLAAEEVDRLAEIFAAGELDAEQYAWAVQRALAKVPDATGGMVSKVGDLLGSLGSIMQASGEKNFGIAKAFSVAQAVLKGYEAVTSAYAAGSLIGGPPMGALYAATAAAATAAQIANIMSTTSKSTSMKGASSGGSSPAPAAPSSAPTAEAGTSKAVHLSFYGPGRGFFLEIIEGIQEALGDGAKLIVND